ncbi:hypothetical protein WN51_12010 [Melipona quadrifasciata]|uniref:F-box domain-containing protein n=1 Tax=Melipona quadrifasciata TaxID=166423 RepID=A0A0M9A4C7_9HYME|nr:hypothetical protein WN51_12010 [Melipona quadrifasciata]
MDNKYNDNITMHIFRTNDYCLDKICFPLITQVIEHPLEIKMATCDFQQRKGDYGRVVGCLYLAVHFNIPMNSKKKANYCVQLGHSLWFVNQLLAQEGESALKVCKPEILADLRNQFCCCAIPLAGKKHERKRRKEDYVNEYLCPCLNIKDSKQRKVDFIANLPIEVSQLILRMLTPTSLFHAVRVSKKWLQVCKLDSVLREKARVHKQKEMEMEARIVELGNLIFENQIYQLTYRNVDQWKELQG